MCNGVADLTKHATPRVCYGAEFCHSTLNIGEPQNGERWSSGPLGRGVADPQVQAPLYMCYRVEYGHSE